MAVGQETRALQIEDLYRIDSKAELVQGKIVFMPPTGFMPGNAAGVIYASLLAYARLTKSGRACPTTLDSL